MPAPSDQDLQRSNEREARSDRVRRSEKISHRAAAVLNPMETAEGRDLNPLRIF